MYVPGESGIAVPLTIALLEADVITERMLRPGRNTKLVEILGDPDERELSGLALTKWWNDLVKAHPTRFFRWSIVVQELHLEDATVPDEEFAWFCTYLMSGKQIPVFTVEKGLSRLEALAPGFGQTVLAVLLDATRYLPESAGPWTAYGTADWLHWQETEEDEELIQMRMDEDGVTREEATANVLTRAEFFKHMPEWACSPKRILSRAAIVRKATTRFARDVIAACDAITAFVTATEFDMHPYDIGVHKTGTESVEICLCIRWNESDPVPRMFDDFVNLLGQSGDYCEFVDARPVPLTAAGILEYQAQIRQQLIFARLVERLLQAIGERI